MERDSSCCPQPLRVLEGWAGEQDPGIPDPQLACNAVLTEGEKKSRKSEPEGCGLRWYLRASSTPHLADTDPCPGGLLVCSGCPPGFRPQALVLTSSWILLLLFLFLLFFGFECIYPFPQGVERLTLGIYLPASLYLLLLIHPLLFHSLSYPVRVGSNSLSRFFVF